MTRKIGNTIRRTSKSLEVATIGTASKQYVEKNNGEKIQTDGASKSHHFRKQSRKIKAAKEML